MCICTTGVDPYEATDAQIAQEQKTQHQVLAEAKVEMGQPSLDGRSRRLPARGWADTSTQLRKSHQLPQLSTWPRESQARFEGL